MTGVHKIGRIADHGSVNFQSLMVSPDRPMGTLWCVKAAGEPLHPDVANCGHHFLTVGPYVGNSLNKKTGHPITLGWWLVAVIVGSWSSSLTHTRLHSVLW